MARKKRQWWFNDQASFNMLLADAILEGGEKGHILRTIRDFISQGWAKINEGRQVVALADVRLAIAREYGASDEAWKRVSLYPALHGQLKNLFGVEFENCAGKDSDIHVHIAAQNSWGIAEGGVVVSEPNRFKGPIVNGVVEEFKGVLIYYKAVS